MELRPTAEQRHIMSSMYLKHFSSYRKSVSRAHYKYPHPVSLQLRNSGVPAFLIILQAQSPMPFQGIEDRNVTAEIEVKIVKVLVKIEH
jgi:hypothetical protein